MNNSSPRRALLPEIAPSWQSDSPNRSHPAIRIHADVINLAPIAFKWTRATICKVLHRLPVLDVFVVLVLMIVAMVAG